MGKLGKRKYSSSLLFEKKRLSIKDNFRTQSSNKMKPSYIKENSFLTSNEENIRKKKLIRGNKF